MRIILFLLLLLCVLDVHAQSNESYRTISIDLKSGLSSNAVNDCVADANGHLWIATNDGITRYAGKRSILFNSVGLKSLKNPVVNRLMIMDSILLATSGGEIYQVNINTLELSSFGFDDKYGIISDMVLYKDSILLALTKTGILVRCDIISKKVSTIRVNNVELMKICLDQKGNAFISMNGPTKVFKYNIQLHKFVKSYENLDLDFYSNVKYLQGVGVVFFGTKMMFRYNDQKDSFEPFQTKMGPIVDAVYTDNNYFYAPRNHSLYYTADTTFRISKLAFKNINPVVKINIDSLGNIYSLTKQGLLLSRKVSQFHHINESLKLDSSLKVRRSIVEDHKRNRIFFFSYQGIEVFNTKKNEYEHVFTEIKNACATSKDDRYIWITTEGTGLYRLELSNLQLEHVYFKRGTNNNFISILKDGPGNVLVGGYNSLFLYNEIENTMREIDLTFGGRVYKNLMVLHIVRRTPKEIWVATSKGVFVLNNTFKVIHHYGSDEKGEFWLPSNTVNTIHFADNGCFFGLDNDLYFISFINDIGNSVFAASFTTCKKVVSIHSDTLNRIWIATYSGLYCYNPTNKLIRPFSAPYYYKNDEFNRTASMISSDGILYLGTVNEYIKIDPLDYSVDISNHHIAFNDVIVSYNKASKVFYDLKHGGILKLPTPNASLKLSFILQDFSYLSSANYFYKIEGLTAGWISLEDRNYLELLSLPGGEWNLQIKAISIDQLMYEPIALTLFVPILFYKTIWFYFIVAFLVGLLFYGIFHFRLNNYKKYLAFRVELANELHDTVGTAVTKSIHAAEGLLYEQGIKDVRLQKIADYGRQVNAAFRDALWSADERTDSLHNLVDRIIEIGHSSTEGTRFSFHFHKQSAISLINLDLKQKRNILMIVREAIHNVLKHSSGDAINLFFKMEAMKVQIEISDNGQNTNKEIAGTGMGIRSMKQRALNMNASINFSADSNGFYIKLKLKS
jgi:ligand-binding sensor domain-containing protein